MSNVTGARGIFLQPNHQMEDEDLGQVIRENHKSTGKPIMVYSKKLEKGVRSQPMEVKEGWTDEELGTAVRLAVEKDEDVPVMLFSEEKKKD